MTTWTDSMDKTLRTVAQKGGSYQDAADAIGGRVTRCAVAGRANRIGIVFRGKPKGAEPRPLTDDQVAFIKDNYMELSDAELAERIGRGVMAVARKRRELWRAGELTARLTDHQKEVLSVLSQKRWMTSLNVAVALNGARTLPVLPSEIWRVLTLLADRGFVECQSRVVRSGRRTVQAKFWRLASQQQEIAA